MKKIMMVMVGSLLLLPVIAHAEKLRVISLSCMENTDICGDIKGNVKPLWDKINATLFADCTEKNDCSMEDPADPGSGKIGTGTLYDLGSDHFILLHESVPPGAYGGGVITPVLVIRYPMNINFIVPEFEPSPANEKLKDNTFLQCDGTPTRGGSFNLKTEQFTREESSNSAGKCVVRCVWDWDGSRFEMNKHSIIGNCGDFKSPKKKEPLVLFSK